MTARRDSMDHPTVFQDFTVVEVSHTVAGAKCGRLLAEFGADVVLVEESTGHPLRGIVDDEATASHYFETLMAGKRSVVVDEPLESPVVDDLMTAADVFVTDYETVPAGFPEADEVETGRELLYCSITPFGLTGDSPIPEGSEAIVQATTGITGTSGFPDGPPAITAVPISSSLGAFIACASILARWYDTGDGGTIDVSLQDAILPLLTTFLPEHFATGEPVGRSGNHHPLAAPWNTYRASDDWVYFIAWTDGHWKQFIDMAGFEELSDDARFETVQKRLQNVDTVDSIVEEWIEGRTVEEVISLATDHGLTAAPIRNVQEAFGDTNLEYRDMVMESGGHIIAGSPFTMSETPGRPSSPAPRIGEDKPPDDTRGDSR